MTMDSQVVDTDVDQSAIPAGNGAGPPVDGPPTRSGGGGGDSMLPVARQCGECGSDMLDGQDWCLVCGTAAPGRLGSRPGWRAVSTVSTLTLLLVLGAVAASYAALSQDANDEAAAPPQATTTNNGQVAQLPPSLTTPATTTPVLPGTTAAGTPTLPTTSTPSTSLPSLPSLPAISTPTNAVTTAITPTTTHTTATTPASTTESTSTTTTTTTTPTTTTAELTPIALGADAVALYDPYKHATNSTDPADSYDGKESTQTSVTTDPAKKTMDVGLVIDLGSSKTVRAVEIHTSTPDFALELYGADGTAIPTDILDARWQHLRSRLHVDGPGSSKPADGIERIKLKKPADVRHVLLWFARPPKAGSTVKISEIKVLK